MNINEVDHLRVLLKEAINALTLQEKVSFESASKEQEVATTARRTFLKKIGTALLGRPDCSAADIDQQLRECRRVPF